MAGGSLTSKPAWSNTCMVFDHAGFFLRIQPKMNPREGPAFPFGRQVGHEVRAQRNFWMKNLLMCFSAAVIVMMAAPAGADDAVSAGKIKGVNAEIQPFREVVRDQPVLR